MNIKFVLGLVLISVCVTSATAGFVPPEFLEKLDMWIDNIEDAVGCNKNSNSAIQTFCDAFFKSECEPFPTDLEFCSSVDTLPKSTKWDSIINGLQLLGEDVSLVRLMDDILGKLYEELIENGGAVLDVESLECREAIKGYFCTNGMASFGEAGNCSEGQFACKEDCEAVITKCFNGARADLVALVNDDKFCISSGLIEDIFGSDKVCPLKLLDAETTITSYLADSDAACEKLNHEENCRELEFQQLLNVNNPNAFPIEALVAIIAGCALLIVAVGAGLFYTRRKAAVAGKGDIDDAASSGTDFTQVSHATRT